MPNIECVEVIEDHDNRVAKYYNIKATPEFIFCYYGWRMIAQVGNKYETLEATVKE